MLVKKEHLHLVWVSPTSVASFTHVGSERSHLQEPADVRLANEMSFWPLFYDPSVRVKGFPTLEKSQC